MRNMPGLVCWNCGFSLEQLTLPIGRRDVCPSCDAELHSCRGCVDFDPAVAQQCREPTAEEVTNKGRANFCDHFTPKPHAYVRADASEAQSAEAQLKALFGEEIDDPQDSTATSLDPTAKARLELEQLFGKRSDENG